MTDIQLLPKETYLQMIRNSVGSKLFRTVYALVNGERRDILQDGDLSCAFFVSSVLIQFKLIKEVHTTVSGAVRDIENSGWVKTDTIVPGAVIVWELQSQADGEEHAHVGFVLDKERAISNSYKERTPTEHSIHMGAGNNSKSERAVTAIYTHPFLEKE